MYDREMFSRACTSPFIEGYNDEIIRKEIEDSFAYHCRSCVVEAYMVPLLMEIKKKYPDSPCRTGMTIGYPFGGYSTETKIEMAKYAVAMGVDEVDVGINITAVLSGDMETVKKDLAPVVKILKDGGINVACVSWLVRLSLQQIDAVCQMYRELGVNSVKTSAGLHFGDMKVEHVEYVHRHFPDLSIEVAGRCRSREKAEAMHAAGADYFHMSSWRRVCGGGNDVSFNMVTKKAEYAAYHDRL